MSDQGFRSQKDSTDNSRKRDRPNMNGSNSTSPSNSVASSKRLHGEQPSRSNTPSQEAMRAVNLPSIGNFMFGGPINSASAEQLREQIALPRLSTILSRISANEGSNVDPRQTMNVSRRATRGADLPSTVSSRPGGSIDGAYSEQLRRPTPPVPLTTEPAQDPASDVHDVYQWQKLNPLTSSERVSRRSGRDSYAAQGTEPGNAASTPEPPPPMDLPSPPPYPMPYLLCTVSERAVYSRPSQNHPFEQELKALGWHEPEEWRFWRSNIVQGGKSRMGNWADRMNHLDTQPIDWWGPKPYEQKEAFKARITQRNPVNDEDVMDRQFAWREANDPTLATDMTKAQKPRAIIRRLRSKRKGLAPGGIEGANFRQGPEGGGGSAGLISAS